MARGDVPRLDRRITLMIPGPLLDPPADRYGQERRGEPTPVLVWAQRDDSMPRDQLDWDNDARLNVNAATFIIRHRTGIEAGMNIIDDEGKTRCVVGRAPLPRRMRYLALLCERTA